MSSWKRIYTEKEKDTTVTNGSSNLATTTAINTALSSKVSASHTHTIDDIIDFVEVIYPIGSIYFTINSDNPNQLFTGTTWTRIEDKFLLASSSAYPNESTGGYTDAINVSHTHIQNSHTHTQNGHTHAIPSSKYAITIGTSANWGYQGPVQMKSGSGNYYYVYSNTNGNGIGERSELGGKIATNQSTVAENNSAGEDGTNKNMPPFIIVNCWERTG